MNRIWTFGLFVALLMPGCLAENDPETFYIMANRLINRSQNCSVKSAAGQMESVPVGTMDLLQTNRFLMFPMVENGLTPVEEVTGVSPQTLSLEANNITVTGAWISYDFDGLGLQGSYRFTIDSDGNGTADILEIDEDGDGEPDVNLDDFVPSGKMFVPTSGYVEAGESATVAVEVVPPPIGVLLDEDIAFNSLFSGGVLQTKIVLQAFMADGTELKSLPFSYPVRVCRGCLVNYDLHPNQCCYPTAEPSQIPCFPGQDESSSCALACMVLTGADRAEKKVALLKQHIFSLDEPLPDTTEAENPDEEPVEEEPAE